MTFKLDARASTQGRAAKRQADPDEPAHRFLILQISV